MNWEILYKYIKGNCTEQELRQLGQWLQEKPANEDFFKTFIEHWGQEDEDLKEDAQAAWKRFKKKRNLHVSSGLEPISGTPPKKSRQHYSVDSRKVYKYGHWYWYSSAAAALILFVALFFVVQHSSVSNESTDKGEEIATQEIVTSKGQRTNLKLSDGSQVMLNSESKLKIPDNYARESRTIYLEGEAFFEVDHDEKNPFVVITPQGYVKDLGTQFNVMTYNSNKIEVAVKEGLASMGEVEANSPQKELVELTPNKLGVLKNDEGLVVSDIEDMNVFTGWTEGKLVFKEMPFPEVVRRLERWYDIECVIEDSELTERTLSATYDNMPLNEVLEVLSISVRASYERNNRTIIFKSNTT